MSEPQIAIVFTPEPWVEELHRHCTDHGGALVRQVLIDPELALEEPYDVLVVSLAWPALTRGFVDEVHARDRQVLGVFDRDDRTARDVLGGLGVDGMIESDAGAPAVVRSLTALTARRGTSSTPGVQVPRIDVDRGAPRARLVVVGGQAGAGRTEVAVHLGAALARRSATVLVDADEVAPSIAARLGLPIEPNLRTAIDAVEHGEGELSDSVVRIASRCSVLAGLPNPRGWSQLRPGEVMRVLRQLADGVADVVVDAAPSLEDAPGTTRGRYALTRALVGAADVLVAVCHATPVGVTRLLTWAADARDLAADTPIVAVVNRAPRERFRRGELFDEIVRTVVAPVVFVPDDPHVAPAAWDGVLVRHRRFARAIDAVVSEVRAVEPARAPGPPVRVREAGAEAS
jgi:Mrp family chromosome partitioning ATPase